MDLVSDFQEIVAKHGWQESFEAREGRKLEVKFLLAAVRPFKLRQKLQELVNVKEPRLQKSPEEFLDRLKDKVTSHVEWEDADERPAKLKRTESGVAKRYDQRSGRDEARDDRRKKGQSNRSSTESAGAQPRGGPPKIDKKRGKDLICYLCKKPRHPVVACPSNLTKDQIAQILDERKKNLNKSQKKGDYVLVCRMARSDEEANSRVLARICEGSYMPAVLDSGTTEVCLIPRTIAQEALKKANLNIERLDPQVKLRLDDNETEIESTDAVTADIRLKTKAGELITRKNRCLIWDVPSDEIILGGDLLKQLGIDPHTALDTLIIENRPIDNKKDEDEVKSLKITEDIEERNEEIAQRISPAIEEVDIGAVCPLEIECSLNDMIKRAADNGLPEVWQCRLSSLIRKYKSVWRKNLGPDPPAEVTPFVTQLKPNVAPYKCKARKYSPEDSEFLKEFTDELSKYGLIEENYNSKWASPVLVVKKSDGGRRMTVDLRGVNALCESTVWPMPFMEAIVNHLAGSKIWFNLDAFKGFWMMPLSEDCREMFSFMTDRGVYTPFRYIQGALNSATQFQARMSEVFKDLMYKKLIIWIDDLLGYCKNYEDWYNSLEETLKIAKKFNIKFNVTKCDLFANKVKFCGRVFSPEGVEHDPARIEALLNIPQPKTARDLQQFLMAVQWMSRSIPEFNSKVYKLQQIFEECMKKMPSRKKSVARQVRLMKFGWGPEHALAFEKLKIAVAQSARLGYPREDRIQCVFTDANDYNASGMVTQIPVEDAEKPVELQRHEPLGFVGHRFNAVELNWSVIEKEGFAIKDTMQKLDYLLQMKRPFKLFVDHKNLVQIFSPKEVSKPTAQKLQRWALELQRFNYEIEHISGEQNVWADLMTRWGAPDSFHDTAEKLTVRVRRIKKATIREEMRVRPLHREDFKWPNLEEIRSEQNKWLNTENFIRVNSEGLKVLKDGRIIIPDQSEDLKTRLCVIAHSGGNSGHLGYQAATKKLAEFCWWKCCEKDMRELCKLCLHCLPTRGGVRIPRPLGEAVHGTQRNEVLHMDYIYVMPEPQNGYHDFQWNLILREDLTGMIKITPAHTPNAMVTVEALMEWLALFGSPQILVTDMASYFMSEVMGQYDRRCNMKHHMTVAYGHYNNGSIEVINKNYLLLIRALLSELRWDKHDWPYLNHNIEHTINHREQTRLNGNAPITVMMGLTPDNPLSDVFWHPGKRVFSESPLSQDKRKKSVIDLDSALQKMHREVQDKSAKQRAQKRAHKDQFRRLPNFQVGDYVLIGLPEPNTAGKKLFLKWRGPYRITDTQNNFVFEVENIIDRRKQIVHGDRVRYYDDSKLNVTEDIKAQFCHDNLSFEVKEFKGCRISPETGKYQFLVEWKGFSTADNSWEDLENLKMDVPVLVAKYVKKLKSENHDLTEEVTRYINQKS